VSDISGIKSFTLDFPDLLQTVMKNQTIDLHIYHALL
jgi:hypothetical protein